MTTALYEEPVIPTVTAATPPAIDIDPSTNPSSPIPPTLLTMSATAAAPIPSTATTITNNATAATAAAAATATATLVEQEVFYPPTRSIGEGSNMLLYKPQSPVWHCTFSHDGEWLAACYGSPSPCIRLWKKKTLGSNKQPSQVQKPSNKYDAPTTKIEASLSLSPFSSSSTWMLHSTLEGIHERTIRCIAFCPLAKTYILAAASFDGTVTIWEYSPSSDSWECTTQLEGHDNEVKFVSWNATGSLLATCGRDKTIWLWETYLDGTVGGSTTNEFDCIAVLNGHDGDVKCVQFAPSHQAWGGSGGDEIVISASYDNSIKIWAEDTGGDWYCAASISDVHSDTIWSLALSPGGSRLVSASADGSLAIWKCYTPAERKERFPESTDATTTAASGLLWKCVGMLEGAHHHSTVYSVSYAPALAGHGRIVSSGADNRINIYREVNGSTSDQPLFDLDVVVDTDHGDVNCVCWHPRDGSLLCSAGDDGTVRLWKFEP
jgi:cytosolic iron-sulfur protein assembly protein CIAO1